MTLDVFLYHGILKRKYATGSFLFGSFPSCLIRPCLALAGLNEVIDTHRETCAIYGNTCTNLQSFKLAPWKLDLDWGEGGLPFHNSHLSFALHNAWNGDSHSVSHHASWGPTGSGVESVVSERRLATGKTATCSMLPIAPLAWPNAIFDEDSAISWAKGHTCEKSNRGKPSELHWLQFSDRRLLSRWTASLHSVRELVIKLGQHEHPG